MMIRQKWEALFDIQGKKGKRGNKIYESNIYDFVFLQQHDFIAPSDLSSICRDVFKWILSVSWQNLNQPVDLKQFRSL